MKIGLSVSHMNCDGMKIALHIKYHIIPQ